MKEQSNKLVNLIMRVGNGNISAITIATNLTHRGTALFDLTTLDHWGIRGYRLHILFKDCCNSDMKIFDRTLAMIRDDVFTKDQIHKNLDRQENPIPFIDEEVKIDGVPDYGKFFGPGHPKWTIWTEAQKHSFKKRLKAAQK